MSPMTANMRGESGGRGEGENEIRINLWRLAHVIRFCDVSNGYSSSRSGSPWAMDS